MLPSKGLPQEQNKKCFVNLFCGCQTWLLQDSQPCCNNPATQPEETPAARVVSWSSSLQLPTPSPLPWHRHTAHPRHGAFLAQPFALTGNNFSLLHLTPSCPRGEGQFPSASFHPCLGSAFSQEQHKRSLKPLSQWWSGYTERVTGELNTC